MRADLAAPIDLAADVETFITFLVRQNTAGLSASQLNSTNRTLSLELLNANGVSQYDFSFHGQQTDFSIRSWDRDTPGVCNSGWRLTCQPMRVRNAEMAARFRV